MPSLADPATREDTLLEFDPETETFSPTRPPAGEPDFKRESPASPRPSVQHLIEVEDEVKRAEERLALLQEEKKLLKERRKEKEKLNARCLEFTEEKNELVRALTESLPELRDEVEQAQRRAEFLRQMQDLFGQHLEILKTIRPDEWDKEELTAELDHAAPMLNEAKAEIERFEERLPDYGGGSVKASAGRKGPLKEAEFSQWIKIGFAFALPLMIFTALALIVTYLIVSQS